MATNGITHHTKTINGQSLTEEQCLQEHEGLIWKVIHRYKHHTLNSSIDLDDIHQEGLIGLMKAYRHFDDTRGLQFSTYAIPKISGGISNFIRDHYYTMKQPRTVRDKIVSKGDKAPNVILFSTALYKKDNGDTVTFEDSVSHYDDNTNVLVQELLNRLDTRTQQAILLELNGYKQREISRLLKCTQAHVSRILSHGKEQLRGEVS